MSSFSFDNAGLKCSLHGVFSGFSSDLSKGRAILNKLSHTVNL